MVHQTGKAREHSVNEKRLENDGEGVGKGRRRGMWEKPVDTESRNPNDLPVVKLPIGHYVVLWLVAKKK